MIHDSLSRVATYRTLSANLAAAIDFLAKNTFRDLPLGRHDIVGDTVFAVVHAYETKPVAAARWEAHRQYIDLQLMLEGEEEMHVAEITTFTGATPFDEAKDVQFFDAAPRYQPLRVAANEFAIFFPHDVHRPTVAVGGNPALIRKLVFKIRV